MKAFKVYPFNLAAGASQVILAEGSFVRVKSATGDVAITLDDIGPFSPLSVGQGFNGVAFRRIVVTDVSGAANMGTLIVADASFIDQTLAGIVSVIDGEKARTLAGSMFAGSPSAPAVAAQYAYAQLWNPAGSGKNLIVLGTSVSVPAAMAVNWVATGAAAATDQSASNQGNKKIAAPYGIGQLRVGSAAALPTANVLRGVYAPANAETQWNIKGAVIVPPGVGFAVIANTVNVQIAGNFEWFEENVT